MTHELSRETLTAQALGEVDTASAALVPPIHVSTIYEANPDGTAPGGRAYTRADNPTYEHAVRILTVIQCGAACMLFAFGSTATSPVSLALLPANHVLVSRIPYFRLRYWLALFGIGMPS